MAQPIQLILARQLAAHLNVPIILIDPNGSLIFYNEAAETMVGGRFQETGEMPWHEWTSLHHDPVDDNGQPIPPAELPIMIALKQQRPVHKSFTVKTLDGMMKRIEVTSIPIVGLQGDVLGAASLFWER